MSSGHSNILNKGNILKMGSHLTWKELNSIEKSILKREEQTLKVRHVNFDTLPTYFVSIRNLYGYILYRLEDISESIEVFKDVLEKDPDNLNAVNNLVEIYNKLGKLRIANTYKEKLDQIIEQRKKSIITRAFCERAHAVRHFQQDCRDFTYMPYLCNAIALGAKMNTPERSEWLFDYGLALFRKDFQLLLAHASSEEKEPTFLKAIHVFYDVTQVDGGPEVYKALSWVFIGILLRHDETRSMKRSFPNHPAIHDLSSIDCIEFGLQISPENQIVTRRVASEFSRVGRHEEAAQLFKKSIDKEKSWFAYRHQGLMYLRIYEAKRDQEMLLKAEISFKEAIEQKDVHADHSDLGYVYFLLGPSHWDQALQRFCTANLNAHNDNFDTTETHRRWAECLRACGENESATRHLELAKDMKKQLRSMIAKIEERDRNHGTNCNGNECELYHSEYYGHEREGFVNVIIAHDLPYRPMHCFNHEFTGKKFCYDFFLSFSHIDHKWAISLLKKLEKEFNMIGCLRYRDYRLGISKMENIVTSIKKSYKTIIIMSPDSIEDNWCIFEVKRAALENVNRDGCTIPLMLRQCQVPMVINELCGIKCESGQLYEHDWIRLGEELKRDNG